jgi:hypothetical protein
MRSFTALTLLLALIGVLQTNAGGAFNLEGKGKGKGSRRLKSDPNVADGGGNKKSVDAQSVECGAGSTKGPKDSRKLKKADCEETAIEPIAELVAPIITHSGCDKQFSKTAAAASIAGSIIWFVM